jgi:N4-gp56 family major capsid protein
MEATMAGYQNTTSTDQTVKLWNARLAKDTTADSTLLGMMKSAGIIEVKEDTSKGAGDQVKYSLRSRLTNTGLVGMQAAAGNEQGLDFYQDSLLIDQVRNVVNIPAPNTIQAQRVQFNLNEESYMALKDWMVERQTVSIFNQLAGNNATSIIYDGTTYAGDLRKVITGCNSVSALAATRVIRANGLATDALVNADTTATMSLAYIRQAEDRAMTVRPYILPLNDGGIKYHCYVHIDGFRQLLEDTTDSSQHRDFLLAQIQSGAKKEALIGKTFDYSQTRIIAVDKLPNGVDSNTAQTNTRRAVFVGRQAATMALGQGYGTAGYSFKQDDADVKNRVDLSITAVMGIKRSVYNSVDYGAIAIVHYVA